MPPRSHAAAARQAPRLGERAAYGAGARAVEWRPGRRHWKMLITLPDGRTFTHLVARRLSSLFQDNIPNWIGQRVRQEMRRERNPS